MSKFIVLEEYSKLIGRKVNTVKKWIRENKILPCAVEITRQDERYYIRYEANSPGDRMVCVRDVVSRTGITDMDKKLTALAIEAKKMEKRLLRGQLKTVAEYSELTHQRLTDQDVYKWIRGNIPLPGVKGIYHQKKIYLFLDKNVDLDLLEDSTFELPKKKEIKEDSMDFAKEYTYNTRGISRNARRIGLK